MDGQDIEGFQWMESGYTRVPRDGVRINKVSKDGFRINKVSNGWSQDKQGFRFSRMDSG